MRNGRGGWLIAAVVLVVLAATGCEGAAEEPDLVGEVEDDGGVDLPEATVKPRPGMVDVQPVWLWFEYAWADAENTLLVTYGSQGPPCEVLDRVESEEHDGGVTVTLYEGRDPELDPAEPCDGPKDRVFAVEVPLEGEYGLEYLPVTNGGSETDGP